MNNYIHYKGYTGTVEYTTEDDVLHGMVLGIRGLISYEGDSLVTLKADFRESIDDYLEMCAENGYNPETPVMPTEETKKPA
jgi:predicted HicB family RNase H-like nuclease